MTDPSQGEAGPAADAVAAGTLTFQATAASTAARIDDGPLAFGSGPSHFGTRNFSRRSTHGSRTEG